MTTLADLMNDFSIELKKRASGLSDTEAEIVIKELVQEYIDIICKRWVGQE